MDTGSLLLILSLAILTGLLVARPFYSDALVRIESDQPEKDMEQREMKYRRLLEERDRFLSDLQELDVDIALGKADLELRPNLRDEIESTIKSLTNQIDEFDRLFSEEIRVQKPDELPIQKMDVVSRDPIEEMIAARRRTRNEKSAGFCSHCGKVIKKSDLYCPACGSKVN